MVKNEINLVEQVTENIAQEKVSSRTERYRQRVIFGYLTSAIIGFVILTAVVKISPSFFKIDLTVTKFIQQFNNEFFLWLMGFVSIWGYEPYQTISIATVLLAMFFIMKLKKEAIVLLGSIVATSVLSTLLKSFVERPRPSIDVVNVIKHLSDSSFPSGHVLSYVVFFGFLAFLAITQYKVSILRNIFIAITFTMILLVGPSRIYLGAHWFSDVLGSYLLGSICLIATIYIYQKAAAL